MLIQIDKIVEQLEELVSGSSEETAGRLYIWDLAPRELAMQVSHAIRYWHNCQSPRVHLNGDAYTRRLLLMDAISVRLKNYDWECPAAFFEEPQVRCPATGFLLQGLATHDWWNFPMAADHVILHDGSCCPARYALFTDRQRDSDVTGWYHCDDCTTIDDEIYPDWYAEEHAQACSNCGEFGWNHEFDETRLCRSCGSDHQDAQYLGGLAPVSFVLARHDDTSSVSLRPQCRKPNRYGIELEICVDGIGEISNNARRRKIVATHAYHATKCFPDNYVVAKRDGSLYDCGFELVTKPDTYARMHKTLAESMPKFSPLLNNGGEACEGEEIEAGLHINVERRGKSVFQQAKMLYFMFNPVNEEFLVAVANRRSPHYAGFPGRARWDDLKRPPFNCGSSKYTAVHVKQKVLEFRLFSSFTHPDLVLSCLEFCEALTRFAEVASARSLLAPEFIQFVLDSNNSAALDDFSPSVFPHLAQRFRSPRFRSFLQNK